MGDIDIRRYGEISGDIILRDPYVATPPAPQIMDFLSSSLEISTETETLPTVGTAGTKIL